MTFGHLKHDHCFVNPTKCDTKVDPVVSYTDKNELYELFDHLQDIEGFTIDKERYQACELFFNPTLLEETAHVNSIIATAAEVIRNFSAAEPGESKEVLKGLCIAGYGSLFSGFGERFHNEMKEAYPTTAELKVICPPVRGDSPWIGGSILGSLSTFSKMWISQPEYEESGPNIVHRKCF